MSTWNNSVPSLLLKPTANVHCCWLPSLVWDTDVLSLEKELNSTCDSNRPRGGQHLFSEDWQKSVRSTSWGVWEDAINHFHPSRHRVWSQDAPQSGTHNKNVVGEDKYAKRYSMKPWDNLWGPLMLFFSNSITNICFWWKKISQFPGVKYVCDPEGDGAFSPFRISYNTQLSPNARSNCLKKQGNNCLSFTAASVILEDSSQLLTRTFLWDAMYGNCLDSRIQKRFPGEGLIAARDHSRPRIFLRRRN